MALNKFILSVLICFSFVAASAEASASSYSVRIKTIYPRSKNVEIKCEEKKICVAELHINNNQKNKTISVYIYIASGGAHFKFKLDEDFLSTGYGNDFYISVGQDVTTSKNAALYVMPPNSQNDKLVQSPVLRSTNIHIAKLKITLSPETIPE